MFGWLFFGFLVSLVLKECVFYLLGDNRYIGCKFLCGIRILWCVWVVDGLRSVAYRIEFFVSLNRVPC